MYGFMATVLALMATACSHVTCSRASVEEQAAAQIVVPTGISRPDRVCEPVGSVPSPDGRWTAFLRRAEWDRPGFQIPYLLTELWIVERLPGVRRRILDVTQLTPDWSSRFSPVPNQSGRAGGFTFREMSWSPSSRAIALEDAGDEWRFRGTIIVDVDEGRILELKAGGLTWSPDGSRAALCNGLGFECPDGLLVVDITRADVRHELAGMNVIEYGWQGINRLAVLGYLKDNDRYGWWEYDAEQPAAPLRPIELPAIVSPTPATTTWWAPEPSGRLPCKIGNSGDPKPDE
jgi:hypothetical protein